jgi:hypothetical protein
MQLPGFWRRKMITHPRIPRLLKAEEDAPYQPSDLAELLLVDLPDAR